MARQIAGEVAAGREKERLFRSQEGIEVVQRQVDAIYTYVEDVLHQLSAENPGLKLQWERDKAEMVIRTPRTSARINWYQFFGNVIDDSARLTIWTYKWLLLLPSERGRYSYDVKPEEISETIFRPEYTASERLCWLDDAGHTLKPTAVGDRLIEEFFNLVKVHERSDEDPYDRREAELTNQDYE